MNGVGSPSSRIPIFPESLVPKEVALMRTELVTTLKRKATEIIADLESSQDPVLITQHGKPAAYLMEWKHSTKAASSHMRERANAWRDG